MFSVYRPYSACPLRAKICNKGIIIIIIIIINDI
jgi:hypothetical protein